MVKVFGCRPLEVARLGAGRRTETFTTPEVPAAAIEPRNRTSGGNVCRRFKSRARNTRFLRLVETPVPRLAAQGCDAAISPEPLPAIRCNRTSPMSAAGPSRSVQADAVQSPAIPRPSDRFGNVGPCGYAALEWSASTWRIRVGLSNLPRITSVAATQPLFETAS
jgi:hypothetical protein